MRKLHNKIIKAVNRIREETVRTNIEGAGKSPLIISENDLCCHLFKELYNPKKYSISTEATTAKGVRSDLIIFDKSKSKYKLTKNRNPIEWDCRYFLVIMELKVNWFAGLKNTKSSIRYDLYALSRLKKKSKLRYMIMFDFKGNLEKKI